MSPVRRVCGGPGTLIFRGCGCGCDGGWSTRFGWGFAFRGHKRGGGVAGVQALCGDAAGQGLSEDFQVRSEIYSIFTGLYIQIKPLKHGLNLVHQGKRGVR